MKKKKEFEKKYYHITMDILNGMTFQEAAEEYKLNSRQYAQKIFRLTVVNFFTMSYTKEIVKNNYNIKYLRKLWKDTQL